MIAVETGGHSPPVYVTADIAEIRALADAGLMPLGEYIAITEPSIRSGSLSAAPASQRGENVQAVVTGPRARTDTWPAAEAGGGRPFSICGND